MDICMRGFVTHGEKVHGFFLILSSICQQQYSSDNNMTTHWAKIEDISKIMMYKEKLPHVQTFMLYYRRETDL